MDARFFIETRRLRAVAALTALLAAGASTRWGALWAAGPEAARREDEETRLLRVRRDIEDLKARLARNETAAGSVLDAMEELDLRMALLRREAQSLRDETRVTSERERNLRGQAETLTSRLRDREASLRGYLRETYKIGPARYLRVVAAAATPGQVASGYRAIEAMSLKEGERIAAYRDDTARLDEAVAALRGQTERLRELQAELDDKTRDLRDVRAQKGDILAGLRREQASQKTLLGELVEVESQVQALLERLAKPGASPAVPSKGFARYRGQLDWPARGRLAVPFGNVRHPRFSTEVPHPGVDIAASPGQDVRAVFDGRVIFSDWFKGYGQMVVIDHGDSYLSIYGHVDERLVATGEDVSRGDPIARSGQSGSFEQPGLYFEIRHDGKPENPARWLRAEPGALVEGKRAAPRQNRDIRRTP